MLPRLPFCCSGLGVAGLLLNAACVPPPPLERLPASAAPVRLLQGIWALDSTENALFAIDARTVVFTEHQREPVRYRLAGDTLVLRYGRHLVVRDVILKLDPDSLVLRSESGEVSHLYRRVR